MIIQDATKVCFKFHKWYDRQRKLDMSSLGKVVRYQVEKPHKIQGKPFLALYT